MNLSDIFIDLQNLREYLETDDPDLNVARYRLTVLENKIRNATIDDTSPQMRGELIANFLSEQFTCEYLMQLHAGTQTEAYDDFIRRKFNEVKEEMQQGILNS